MAPTLYIGNKNYSSWSLRPWLALRAKGIAFEEVVIPFDFPAGNPAIKAVSASGRVPLLLDGETRIWESLAIIEYAAEKAPEAGMWPQDRARRGVARAISMEMLAGFRALRNACPMNIRRAPERLRVDDDVRADIARITSIWREMLAVSGGPFLFGEFSGADAMYAPVVSRFATYQLVDDADILAYMGTVQGLAAWREWREAALAETWIVPEDEI